MNENKKKKRFLYVPISNDLFEISDLFMES